jgi:hypothetical protein
MSYKYHISQCAKNPVVILSAGAQSESGLPVASQLAPNQSIGPIPAHDTNLPYANGKGH